MNKVPIKNKASPAPKVAKTLSKGERKIVNIIIGKTVSDVKIKRPDIVILCLASQLLHLNGWYIQ